jgi:flagellar hook-associated protein 1 FlgK
MASIFDSLHIGYSGLNASQIGINTTGHNVANAETEGYSRQRVVQSAAYPLTKEPGDIGNGAKVETITRIFDTFVYDRYTKSAEDKAYTDYMREGLETLSTYFPEIEDVGIKSDLHTYFDMWQSLADNPDNTAVKVALAQQAQVLSDHIQQTRDQVRALQEQQNDQLKSTIEDINRIAGEIAGLNKAISLSEAGGQNNANDLRDQRNQLELALSKLIGADIFTKGTTTNAAVDMHVAEREDHYNIMVGGFNIVDGATFHPIGISNELNPQGFYDLYYERQDGRKVEFPYGLQEGKVGAILDLRGSTLNDLTGIPEDGILQDVINQLDAFAGGLIEGTNNLYAQSATSKMQSDTTGIDVTGPILNTDLNINEGSFDIVLYDVDGNETARRTITIAPSTVLDDTVYDALGNVVTPGTSNSIVGQINAILDDNQDGNITNDIQALLTASTWGDGIMSLNINNPAGGYTFAIEDDLSSGFSGGTNFAGAMGLRRFFDGNNGHNIALQADIKRDPSSIAAFTAPQDGNNSVAQLMVQLQFADVGFYTTTDMKSDSLYNYFDATVTYVGSKTNSAIAQNDAITAQFKAIEQEHKAISGVSIDEEMTNLIRYQTAYGAAAKVITTVDQMMTTLLGLKQ